MKLTTFKVVLFSAVTVMVLAPVRGAFAANITITADPINATFTKTGLNGYFYSVETDGKDTDTVTSYNAATVKKDYSATSWIAANPTPTGTFTASLGALDTGGGYGSAPNGVDDTTAIKTFLGATDGATYTGTNSNLDTNVITLIGYIDVTSPASTVYTFTQLSNDGSYLTIGGTPVITTLNQNSPSAAAQSASETVVFQNGPGLYAVDLTYWNQAYNDNAGNGNELGLTITGGGASLGNAYSLVVPEPSTWAALMVGGLMMGCLVVRRKKMGLHAARVAN